MIRRAYEGGRGVSETPSFRVHEIRTWASSLAFAHSIRLLAILESAFLKSQGTFIEFYLRDVSRLREDGSRGFQSLIAAQSVLSSRA